MAGKPEVVLMPFTLIDSPLEGLMIIKSKRFEDPRGFFLESFKNSDFEKMGIKESFQQDNHSFSSRGVLRGLHFQKGEHAQGKLVRVVQGAVWDVAVDLRPNSPSFKKWFGLELTGNNDLLMYIPPGFAHGFVTLQDDTHFLYKCTNEYHAEADAGIRWDDPTIDISWPLDKKLILLSDKDRELPLLKEIL